MPLKWTYATRVHSEIVGRGSGTAIIIPAVVASSVASLSKGERVRLAAKGDRRLGSRVEEDVRIIARVLCLNQSIKLRILWRLLAEYRIAKRRRVSRKILRAQAKVSYYRVRGGDSNQETYRRRVLLNLTEFNSDLDHILLGGGVKLSSSI